MEWKFACSTLWLSVFDGHYLVPPPFNLLSSIQWFITQYKRIKGTSENPSCEKVINIYAYFISLYSTLFNNRHLMQKNNVIISLTNQILMLSGKNHEIKREGKRS